ncbi:MAG: hypothetical protein WC861_00385 [Candidatus Micrarchaeia archaeon]
MKNGNILKTFLLVREGARQFAAILGALFVAIALVSVLVALQHVVHEFGHLAGCHLTGLIWNLPVSCSISNIRMIPIYPGILEIPAPQQVRSENVNGSPLVYFGGPFLSMAVLTLLALFARERLEIKNKAFWLLICAILLNDVYGNILCGTDNPTGQPYGMCAVPALAFFNQWGIAALAVFSLTCILYPSTLRAYEWLDAKVQAFFHGKAAGQHNALYGKKRK